MGAPSSGSAFAAFRIRNFRLQWPADLLTSWAFEMETLVLGWYMLVETGSVLMLSLFGALLYVGTLIAPLLGVVGDRVGHRNLLCGMRTVYTVLATTLATLALLGLVTPTTVLVIAGLVGLARPSDMGMRSALIADSMPFELLAASAGISRTTADSARIAGSLAGAGMFATLGLGPTYVFIAGFYAIGLVLTLCISPLRRTGMMPPDMRPRFSPIKDLREGLHYVWNTPHLLAGMWIAFLVNGTAFPFTSGLLPYVAKDVYGTDQNGLGYLAASFAGGALVGSLLLGFIGGRIRPGRMMVGFCTLWYVMLLVFLQMPNAVSGGFALVLVGLAQSLGMVPVTVMLLRTADEKFRGRVMGVRMMAIYSLPIGLLVAGVLIERLGFVMAATVYCVVGILCIAVIGIKWRADIWRVDAVANRR